jgi:hypothetical protein
VIQLRVSKRVLRGVLWALLALGVVIGLYALGVAVTPLDSAGRPLVLSPSLRAAERYRVRAVAWVAQMADIDHRLDALLAADGTTDPAELYAQGQEMQEIGEAAVNLSQRLEAVEVPVALVGLREQACAASDAYVEAAMLVARWLGAPSEAGFQSALEALHAARSLRMELEESRWLQTPN